MSVYLCKRYNFFGFRCETVITGLLYVIILKALQQINTIMKYILILFFAIIGFECSPKLAPDALWGRQNWVLVELKGVPVQQSGGRRDAHIVFDVAQKKFSGNGGCN